MECPNCKIVHPDEDSTCPSCTTPVLSWAEVGQEALKPSGSRKSSSSSSWPEPRLSPGEILAGRYRIVELLGRGGMGEVYCAIDLKLDQAVALKFLPPGREEGDQRWLKRFLAEVRLARQVTHPNVCRVYDVAEADGHHFLSMELIQGETLSSLLRRSGALSEGRAIELGAQLCRGLAAVHQQGVLHRDLKPSNLMIDHLGMLKITDFGLAMVVGEVTDRKVRSGTPAYMSPEQHRNQEVSISSDLYALGLVLYRMLSGRLPFSADSPEALADLHCQAEPPPLKVENESFDPRLEGIILQCLEKEPSQRPSSALEVGRVLTGQVASASGVALKALMLLASEAWPPPSTVDSGSSSSSAAMETTTVAEEEDGGAAARTALQVEKKTSQIPQILEQHGGSLLGTDAELRYVLFDRPIQAVRCALALQQVGSEDETKARTCIHLGEVFSPLDLAATASTIQDVASHARETVRSLMTVTAPGQILLTQSAFDLARQTGIEAAAEVRWIAHGAYEFEGLSEPLYLFEVGRQKIAPFQAPQDSPQCRRRMVQETVSGWRPAPGLPLPERPHWQIEKKLSQGGFGEVWLARHGKTHEARVFKFCYDQASLHSLQREITIFRLLKEALGDREDIVRILDWNFDEAPYFIESEYTSGGDLRDWVEEEGGFDQIPLRVRLDMVAQVATALAAAHSIGVLHKDVKPANILVTVDAQGRPRARLNDFGIGLVTDQQRLAEVGITVLGWDETAAGATTLVSLDGTRLYMAPELLEGKIATLQSDIYALGVMLYQMVIGDLSRALAPGWEREVEDPLLAKDIAAAVDGQPERRLSDALRLAERLRDLDARRFEREREDRERQEAQRMREMLQRSRRRWVMMALTIVILSAFGISTAIQSKRIEAEAETTRQVLEFLQDLIKGSDPRDPRRGERQDLTVSEVLDEGALRVDSDLRNQPQIQARLMRAMGESYHGMQLSQKALPLLEQALTLQRELNEPPVEIASTQHLLASVTLEMGEISEAERLFREGLESYGEDLEPLGRSDLLYGLAHVAMSKGDFERAIGLHRQALSLRNLSLPADDPVIIDSLMGLAYSLYLRGDHDEAENLYQQALSTSRTVLGEAHFYVAEAEGALAQLYHSRGEYDRAEDLYNAALETRRKIFGDEHPIIAMTLDGLALLLHSKGNQAEAKDLVDQALELALQILPEDHPEILRFKNHQARILNALDRPDEAEALFREVLQARRERLGEKNIEVAVSFSDLGNFLLGRERPAEAAVALEASLEILGERSEDDLFLNQTRNLLGACWSALGRYEAAEDLLLSSYEQIRRENRQSSRHAQRALGHLVDLYESWDRPSDAALYRQQLQAVSGVSQAALDDTP